MPEHPELAVKPPIDKVCPVITVAALIVRIPVIVQSFVESVLVFAPLNVTGPGNVFPPLIIVEAADIARNPDPRTDHECAVLSVKFPATVIATKLFIVIVEVYPDVNVNDKQELFAETTDTEFPPPAPSNVTSSDEVGAATRTEPPDVAHQFVVGLAFQFVFVPPPIQNLAATFNIVFYFYNIQS